MTQIRLNAFKNLYGIFGLGKNLINNAYAFSGINTKTFPKQIKQTQQKKIFKKLNFFFLGKRLKKKISDRIKFYSDIRSWKGTKCHRKYFIKTLDSRTKVKSKKTKFN